MTPVEIIGKAVRVIKSCNDLRQVWVAERFCKLAVRKYHNLLLAADDSIRGMCIAYYRANEFDKELKYLIHVKKG